MPRLIISEVHPIAVPDGTPAEAHEWVEILNLGPYRVSLDGWSIEDAQAIARLPGYVIEPGGVVLITGSSAEMHVPPGGTLIVLDTPAIGSGLRNSGDRVALIDPRGIRYDAVSWGDVRTPSYMDPPNPRQSIVRTMRGYQRVADTLTPWTVDEAASAFPERYRHDPPDTRLQFVSALIDPIDDQSESVTIRNVSPEPVRTINWTLTAGASLVRLRSVRIQPGESFTITGPKGQIGAGISRSGGHLVLRDQHGNWLATASWGADRTFHRLPSPLAGRELRFDPLARIHPKPPTHPPPSATVRAHVGNGSHGSVSLLAEPIAYDRERERADSTGSQDTQDAEESVVWISEVLPNAGQGRNDAQHEWFELTNAGDRPIDLTGWTIADNTSSDPLDGLVIEAGQSAVIGVATATTEVAGESLVPLIADGRIGNGLANSGDQLRLINPAGLVVSAISWGDDRTYDAVAAPDAGQSMQRNSPTAAATIADPAPGEIAANVEPQQQTQADAIDAPAATESATPDEEAEEQSSAETITPPQVLRMTEILPAPLSGQPEWVELFNPGDAPIDLDGWSIGDLSRRTELSGVIPARGRLVVSSSPLDSDARALVVDRIGNGLNNDADTIALFDADDREVDRIEYGSDELPAPGAGLSLALDPARWVVTAQPSPGTDRVVPLIEDAYRAAAIRQPISDEGRLPVVAAQPEGGVNAWMIVSFALIGIILTLSVRRWQPPQQEEDSPPEPAEFTGPPSTELPSAELEINDDAEDHRR